MPTNNHKIIKPKHFARLSQLVCTLALSVSVVLGGVFATTEPAYALSAGDIAIIGVHGDDVDGTAGNGNTEGIAWVPLVNLAGGAEIFFTDSGWTAAGAFRGSEGAIKYTVPAGGIAAGTVLLLEFDRDTAGNYTFSAASTGYSDADDAIVGTTGLLPAGPGDNIFIFEGSTAAPTFIWSWKNDGPYDADSTSNSTTALPATLTLGTNAMTIETTEDGTDNSRYVGPTSGTPAQLAAAIANPANWEKAENFPFPGGGNDITNGTSGAGFSVSSADTTPPTASPSQNPAPNGAGWNNSDVTVTWNWTDSGSGIDATNCTTNSTSNGEGSIDLTATCTDLAGNVGNASVTVQVDKTAPTANPTFAPAPNARGWYTSAVTVTYNWTDNAGGSGIDPNICTATEVVTEQGEAVNYGSGCRDLAGNDGLSIGTLPIDMTPPETAIDANPPATSTSDVATFEFSGSDNATRPEGLVFECQLDGGGFTTCASPRIYTGLSNGSHTFDVRAIDDAGFVDPTPASYTWTVAVNAAPTAEAGGPYVIDEGSSVQLDGSGSTDADQDPATLSYAWDFDGDSQYDDATGINPSFAATDGPASVTVGLQVTDDGGLTSTDTADITINNVAPTANAGANQNVFRNETVNLSGTWSDPAGAADNAYTWSWDLDGDGTADDSGSANFGDTINRTTSFVVDGVATLTFTVTDKDGASHSDSVEITVVNRAPVANDQNLSTDEDTDLSITLTGSDADSDALTYTVLSQPSNGVLSGTAPDLTYTPNADFNDSDSFTFLVNDGLIDSSVATINITVNPVNDPPVALDDTATTDEDTLVTIDVQANDSGGPSDEDQTLSTTAVTDPTGGAASINADGTVAYTPNANFNGSDRFDYTVCDSDGACANATVTVLVAMVNDPPVANDDSIDVAEDTATVLNVAANDSDIDGNLDPASTTALTQPGNGTLVNNGDGTFTYTPNLNYFGADGFSYQICDSDSVCTTATVSINVTAVNDAPICDAAVPSISMMWPPNSKFHPVTISGITDVEGDATSINIDTIFQDEPVDGEADGQGIGTSTAELRAERIDEGNGRVYHIGFTASDGNGGTCSGTVQVSVPKSMGKNGTAVDDGPLYDSTGSVNGANAEALPEAVAETTSASQQQRIFLPVVANSGQ